MLIALNLLYLIPGVVGGTETYARSLIKALAQQDEDNEYVIFVNSGAADLDITPAPNFRRVVCPVSGQRRSARYAWEQGVLPIQLRRIGADLVHSLGYVGPLAAGRSQVVTVPDLNFLGHQGRHSAMGRRAFGFFVERSVKRADHVIAISEFTRSEILKYMEVPADKVSVIHLAGREVCNGQGIMPKRPIDLLSDVKGPYILAFSALSAHKNVNRLIAAFKMISHVVPHSLVLVGHLPDKKVSVRAEIEQNTTDRIHFAGFIEDDHLASLMRGASLFAYPSLYEGFGLPVIDAQSAGVPVACSSAGSLPEVAGDGAFFFDPLSVDEIAAALKRCLLDADLRASLTTSGYENARQYSWEKTARETLSVYSTLVS